MTNIKPECYSFLRIHHHASCGLIPVPHPSSQHHSIHFIYRHYIVTGSSKPRFSKYSPSFNISLINFPLSHTCHMTHSSRLSWFDNVENTRQGVKFIKFLTIKFSLVSCVIIPLRSKYLLHTLCHSFLACVLNLMRKTKFHTHLKEQAKL